ncbi:hypothetical protein [Clostridium saccharoperbutylacetonicum]|uniref:hypothetical protein n=1 Tax=Clostridium saccharoperbutylacetonicum TaxID=36745 RepID=UPI0039E8FCAA
MNIEKFAENLNKLSKVKVYDISSLKTYIFNSKEAIKRKKTEILNELREMGFSISTYEEKEVIKTLGLPNINRQTLDGRIATTGKHIYILINELKTLNTHIQGLENLERNIDKDGYIHPKFGVNVNGMVSVAEPALGRLSDLLIEQVIGFDRYTKFEDFDSLYNFIKQYRPMMGVREDNQNSFIVVGMTLFYDFKRVEEWDITKEYEKRIMEMYKDDHIFVQCARWHFVTGETYNIFNEIYNSLYPVLENTKIAIKNGLLSEKWLGSLPKGYFPDKKEDDMDLFPFGINSNEELELEHKERLEARMSEFNNLCNQYMELKAKINNGENIAKIVKIEEITNKLKERLRRKAKISVLTKMCGIKEFPSVKEIEKANIDYNKLSIEVEKETDKMVKKYEIKAETKQEQLKVVEPAHMKIYDLEKNREIMQGYGWSNEVIEKNIAEIKATEDRLNTNFNSPSFVICAEQGNDTVFDFLLSGKKQIKGVRMLFDSKTEDGDTVYDLYVRVKGVRHIMKVTAKKGTAHRTLIVTLPDNTTQTYQASNKKDNIKQMVVGVFNTLC